MLRETLKRNKGITLIALVVTIIVLLILAGISISMLTGQNGILTNASKAKNETGEAQIEEKVKLSVGDALTRGTGTLEDENLKSALNSYIGKDKYKITGDKEKGWTVQVIENGKSYDISSMGKISKSLPKQKGVTEPYLPSDDFEMDEGTSLDTGLVIKDSVGNEYVWVEVPKTSEVYPTAGTKITSFGTDEYSKIETDLHTYTKDYRNGTSYKDDYAPDTTTGWFTETGDKSYDTAKKKMLKSVYEHGGFWVGRYEAGIEKEADIRKAKTDTVTLTPVTKQNMYPYNYVTITQAKVLAEKVESGNCTSSLMFGVQWDLVLKYIETKGNVKSTDLTSNSTLKGNYDNNKWNIQNTKAKYSKDYGKSFTACPYKKTPNASILILLTTGADASFSLMNIYDIAGNVAEWTLENTSSAVNPCAYRGGSYNFNGSNFPARNRSSGLTSHSTNNIGFRLSLY